MTLRIDLRRAALPGESAATVWGVVALVVLIAVLGLLALLGRG
jgi:hypothetical protein